MEGAGFGRILPLLLDLVRSYNVAVRNEEHCSLHSVKILSHHISSLSCILFFYDDTLGLMK